MKTKTITTKPPETSEEVGITMTDRYERIRAALEMEPTPGPWKACPTNSGTFVKSERVAGYLAEVRHCRTTQDVKADAHLIAACDPDTIRALMEERDAMREALKEIRSRSAMNLAMNPNPYALTALLGDIHQIADTAMEEEKCTQN